MILEGVILLGIQELQHGARGVEHCIPGQLVDLIQ